MSENTNTEAILLEYRKTVRNLFDTGASDVIDNSSPRHAAILIEEMVRHAQVSFRAFAGGMNPVVWNINVMNALKEAIERGVNVQLLVEHDCEPILNGTMPDIVRRAVRRCVASGDFDPKNFSHCATGDRQSFRMEMDQDTKTAAFSANNEGFASRVADIFDYLQTKSIPYAA